jgi:hypothetical protein
MLPPSARKFARDHKPPKLVRLKKPQRKPQPSPVSSGDETDDTITLSRLKSVSASVPKNGAPPKRRSIPTKKMLSQANPTRVTKSTVRSTGALSKKLTLHKPQNAIHRNPAHSPDSKAGPKLLTLVELKALGARGVADDIQRGNKALRGRLQLEKRREIAKDYQKAMYLWSDKDAWDDFCRLGIWKGHRGPKRKDRADALKWVLRLGVGWGVGPKNDHRLTDLVNKWNKKLAPLFEQKMAAEPAGRLIVKNLIPKVAQSPTVSSQNATKHVSVRIALDAGGNTVLARSIGDRIVLRIVKIQGSVLHAKLVVLTRPGQKRSPHPL